MTLSEDLAANLLRRIDVTDTAIAAADMLEVKTTQEIVLNNQLYIMQALLAMNEIAVAADAGAHECGS
jgi:hypothetical protein